jgi:hypothetical protein
MEASESTTPNAAHGDEAEWHDTRLCGRCQSLRSYVGFRSHCRVCGRSVCYACTAPAVPPAWLDVPFVRLCKNIPPTHRNTMKCCTVCAQQVQLDELEYVWTHVVNKPSPEPDAAETSAEAQDAYLRTKGRELRQLLDRLTNPASAEFACTGFAHSATEHRLVALDTHTLSAFDLVYGTAKLAQATDVAVANVPLTFTLVVTLLSRPNVWSTIGRAVRKPVFLEPLPSVFGLVHPDHATECLKLLSPPQHLCVYLHRPKDSVVGLAMPPAARQIADAHLDTVAKLAAIAETRDHDARSALAASTLHSPAVLIVRGERCAVTSVGFSCTGVLELVCANSRATFRVMFFSQVDRGLVESASFICWAQTSHVFQSMTVLADGRAFLILPCAPHTHDALRPTHTYAIGGAPSTDTADGAGTRDDAEASRDMWATLKHAKPSSVIRQCVTLTFKQTAEARKVDVSRLRFFLDVNEQLVVYSTGDASTAEQEEREEEAGPRTCVMLADAVDRVREESTGLMSRSREYVYWSAVLLTKNPGIAPLDPHKLLVFSF